VLPLLNVSLGLDRDPFVSDEAGKEKQDHGRRPLAKNPINRFFGYLFARHHFWHYAALWGNR
jgi:hypothetical protein